MNGKRYLDACYNAMDILARSGRQTHHGSVSSDDAKRCTMSTCCVQDEVKDKMRPRDWSKAGVKHALACIHSTSL